MFNNITFKLLYLCIACKIIRGHTKAEGLNFHLISSFAEQYLRDWEHFKCNKTKAVKLGGFACFL